ncbi:MAG TPA: cation transporter, partial [Gemmatimonadales bacterium]|nr:cation transporter [Gemmatimonadales bacterium]
MSDMDLKELDLAIEGMSCGHCLNAVSRALHRLPGVAVEAVQIGRARVRYDEAAISPATIAEAIGAAGYRAAPIP